LSSCVICERRTSGSLDWCREHYNLYKDEIKDKKPWVRSLKNDSQRERRRREKEFENVSLDAIIDRQFYKDY